MTALKEVCRRAGISYRQADHWIDKGYVQIKNKKVGTGYQREIASLEQAQFFVLAQLVAGGFKLAKAVEILPEILDKGFDYSHDRVNILVQVEKDWKKPDVR